MCEAIKIKQDIYYIGVSDPDIRTFDIIMKTANGTTYNSYLIKIYYPNMSRQQFINLNSL